VKNGFRVIDSEPHLSEPYDLWARLPEPYRSLTEVKPPSQGADVVGGETIQLAGAAVHGETGTAAPVSQLSVRQQAENSHLFNARRLGTPEIYLEGFDVEGIDVGVLMPTTGMHVVRYDDLDPQHALALCRVVNDYAAEFASANPERFKFWGWLPPQDARLAAEEARRCVEELGAVGVATTKGAVNGHLFSDEFWDPLWAEVNRLAVPIGFHGPTSGSRGMRDVQGIAQRYRGHRRTRMITSYKTFYVHTTLSELIFGGVLERYPSLHPVMMESGASWLIWFLWELDEEWETYERELDFTLSLKPSEYFRRQCHVVMFPDEDTVRYVVDFIGDRNLLLSTDYPHPDSPYPDAINHFLALEGLSDESKRRILWENGAELYGLAKRPALTTAG
jgi:uncharacterized protein